MRPRLNRLNARVIKGIYKDGVIEIKIGKNGDSSEIKVNGEILDNVIGAHIHIRAGEPTKLCLELFKE